MFTRLPNLSRALSGWLQPMVFQIITKSSVNFQLVETATTANFKGVMQPFSVQQLLIKPEGQRAWKWYEVHAETTLELKVDDRVQFEGVNYRVMGRFDYSKYGFYDYHLIEDYTGSDPS